jgi:hypothetical protein
MKISGVMVSILAVATFFGWQEASAMDMKKPAGPSSALQKSYVWYDGDQERRVWLNPDLTAEFDPGPPDQSPIRKAFPNAKEVGSRQKSVRLWKLEGVGPDEAIRKLKAQQPGGRYSPVLHDSPTQSGRKRALPGNVIVTLNPAWDEAAVKSWAGSRRLEIVQKLEIGPNVFVIKTGPGLEALETANALHRSDGVIAAFPDWWQEVTTR